MAREKVGITLTDETLKRLDEIVEELGMTRSHVISMLVNQEYIENHKERGGKGA